MSKIDWPGLLKWSISYSDGTGESSFKAMSPQDQLFLENAVRDAMAMTKDPYELVQEAVLKLKDKDPAVVLTALHVVESCLDSADIARNLHKLDATAPILDLIWHDDDAIVELALDILAVSLPNNPPLQSDIGNKDGLDNLLLKLESTTSDTIGVKTLGCISALIRNDAKLENRFVENGHLEVLSEAMKSDNEKFQQKASTLAAHLIREGIVPHSEIVKHNIIHRVLKLLNNRNIEETGIQHGEVCAQLVQAVMSTDGAKLSEDDPLNKTLRQAIAGRLSYVERLGSFDTSTEIEILKDVNKYVVKD